MNSYLQATDSSIFIPGSALAAASESESSCTAQGWQQAGHCPSPASAPLSWGPTPLRRWGIAMEVPLCQWRIRDSPCTSMTYCCPGRFSSISDLLIFLSSHKKGCSYWCSHHFFCSTGQQNIQWCRKGDQPLIKTRSQGTPYREESEVLVPTPQSTLVYQEQGQELWSHLCPCITHISSVSLSIAFMHSWLKILPHEIKWLGAVYLADIPHVFPLFLQHVVGQEIPQNPSFFFMDFQRDIQWGNK